MTPTDRRWAADPKELNQDLASQAEILYYHHPKLFVALLEEGLVEAPSLDAISVVRSDVESDANSDPPKNVSEDHDVPRAEQEPGVMEVQSDKAYDFQNEVIKVIVELMKDQRDSYKSQNLDVCDAHRRELVTKDNEVQHLRNKDNPWIVLAVLSWAVTISTLLGMLCYHLQ